MGALLCPHHSPAEAGPATGPAERRAATRPPCRPAHALCAPARPSRLLLPGGSSVSGALGGRPRWSWQPVGRGTTLVLSPPGKPVFELALSCQRQPGGPALSPASPANCSSAERGSLQCRQQEVIYTQFGGEGSALGRGLPRGGVLILLPPGRRTGPRLSCALLDRHFSAKLFLQLLQSHLLPGAIPTNTP